ncbi:MAG: hypothetical protein ACRETH_07345, partial [Steroidobacteraceae bacterium]
MRAAFLACLQPMESHDLKGSTYPTLTGLLEISERCWLADFHTSGREIAQRASRSLGGQWWVGAGAVTWNNGGKCLTLLDRSRAEAVSAARRVGETLMGSCKSWTVGGVARALLQWVGPPQPHRSCTDKALSGVPWSYRVCQPGTYENVALVDLKAAYHQGLARLPSIRLTWLPSGPVWHPMPAAERDRWNALLT